MTFKCRPLKQKKFFLYDIIRTFYENMNEKEPIELD